MPLPCQLLYSFVLWKRYLLLSVSSHSFLNPVFNLITPLKSLISVILDLYLSPGVRDHSVLETFFASDYQYTSFSWFVSSVTQFKTEESSLTPVSLPSYVQTNSNSHLLCLQNTYRPQPLNCSAVTVVWAPIISCLDLLHSPSNWSRFPSMPPTANSQHSG